ncbi:urease accessory protein UreD [SAR116 cluster bacterium]|nr:urease accessory protein UreD [SAR116 cluster bacterium]
MQTTAKNELSVMQRARGAIDLAVVQGKLERFYQSGSAKIFMPKTYAATIEAVLVNTAGGLTGGDKFQVKLSADGDTHLTVSTQTAERIYRALGPQNAEMRVDMALTGPASLHWLPQETILFDGAGFSRQLNVEMDTEASFLASEIIVFGRTAMHESVRQGSLMDQWRIRRGGHLMHAEALRLDGEIASKLDHQASASNSICLATTLYISPVADDAAGVTAVRTFFKDYPEVKTAVSAWDGKLVIRSLGDDTARLKKLLAHFIEQFRKIANPRVWNY